QRHPQHAGDGGHEGADRAHEARDQDALGPVPPEYLLAAVEQLRIAPERPVVAQLRPPAVADPVADAVAQERADGRAGDRVGAVDVAQADQRADPEQQRQRRHQDAEHDDRIAERDQEDEAAGRDRVRADPGERGVEPAGVHRRIMTAAPWPSPTLSPCNATPPPSSAPSRPTASAASPWCRGRRTPSCAATWPTCPGGCGCRPGGGPGARRWRWSASAAWPTCRSCWAGTGGGSTAASWRARRCTSARRAATWPGSMPPGGCCWNCTGAAWPTTTWPRRRTGSCSRTGARR